MATTFARSFGARLAKISGRRGLGGAAESGPLIKTSLYDLHLSIGGKMVPFAGYELPVQYEGLGVLKEHNLTRAEGSATIFDVSHMGQILWRGKDAVKFLEKMVVGDIAGLKEGEAKLSLIMNDKGGIVDDTVITNAGDGVIYMVVNGACKVGIVSPHSSVSPQPNSISQKYHFTQTRTHKTRSTRTWRTLPIT